MRLPGDPAGCWRAGQLFATEDCCVLVDDDLLKQINGLSSVVIATTPNFTFARAGQRIATVKSAPFAVAQTELEAVINIVKERGPILQARPVRNPAVGVLYSDPVHGDRARQLFESMCASGWSVSRWPPASSFPDRGRRSGSAQSAASDASESHGSSGWIDYCSRRPGRRDRPRNDQNRLPFRTISGSRRAR